MPLLGQKHHYRRDGNFFLSRVNAVKNGQFSIATDGSNKSEKYYPHYFFFYSKSNNIQSFSYKVPVLSGDSTGQNISKLICIV